MTTTNLDPLGDANDVRRIGGIPISLVRSESTLLVVLLAIVLLIGGIVVPSVFQLSNLANMSRDAAVVGLGAIGVTFVLLTGELDLSIGSIMSLSLVVGGEFVDEGPVLALLVTALCGLVLGAVNGLAVGFGRVNSLIMTLGTLALVQRSGECGDQGAGDLPQGCRDVHLVRTRHGARDPRPGPASSPW